MVHGEDFLNDSIFISNHYLNGAFNNDVVSITILNETNKFQIEGKITKIITRSKNIFTGFILIKDNQYYISIDQNQSKGIILEENNIELNELDVVEVEIINWNENKFPAVAKLKKVLGRNDQKNCDYLYIASKYGIKTSKETNDSKYFKNILKTVKKTRINLEKLYTFTIDPFSAKDFDDAISIEESSLGYKLYIHIADVAEFVSEGSKINNDAMIAGNTYYFPEAVTHMLPKELSENFCSLKSKEERLVISVIIDFDNLGEVLFYEIKETVIKVHKRFSYEEVDIILSEKKDLQYLKPLELLEQLTKKLKEKRLTQGGFEINKTEISYDLDEAGTPFNLLELVNFKSYVFVEECMLITNKIIAQECQKNSNLENSFSVYRNHERPSQLGENYIKDLLVNIGGGLKDKEKLLSSDINNFIKNIRSNYQRKIISLLILKKLKKARYQTYNNGHFGLGFKEYTHFTSPIRRYPDLLVHRFVKSIIRNKEQPNHQNLSIALSYSNKSEENAKKAEREYSRIKMLKWLSNNFNSEFDGVILEFKNSYAIVGLTISNTINGLLSFNKFPTDQYKIMDNKLAVRGMRNFKTYKVGQKINVIVEKIDFGSQKAYFNFSTTN